MFSLDNFKYQTGEQLITNYVLKPLGEAYSKIKLNDQGITKDNENTITRKIVWYLRHQTSISSFYQSRLIAIEMRPKELENIQQTYEPDIKVFIWDMLWIEIEAKLIYEGNDWSPSEYLGNNGLGRFTSNTYSKDEKFAGMVAYVQNGDLEEIIKKIHSKVTNDKSFKKWVNFFDIKGCLLSVHCRQNNADIEMFHLFFHFTQAS